MSIKMKGLLKGLRYISHIFEEEEKEAEIEIGFPTDVKHVAHIGWDGPSATAPSWMNEFKSSPTSGEANGDIDKDIKSVSQDSSAKKGIKDSPGRDLPNLPKASRRQPSTESVGSVGSADSPMGSPTKTSKASRRRSKHKETSSPKAGESSNLQDIPNIPKKSRRKKSKDGEDSTRSTRPKDKGSKRSSRHGSDDGSVRQFDSEGYSTSGLTTLREEDHG